MTPDKPSASEARELLSCPFCGKRGAISCLEDEHGDPISFWVNCSCGVETHETRTEAEAIAKWNTRASPAPQGGEPSTQISQRLENIMTWLREPDWTEQATLEWIKDWVNRRPIAELAMVVMLMPSPSPAATADQWQPIETAPKDGSKIDLFVTPPNGAIVGSYDGRVCDCWFSNNKWWLYDDSQYATDADNCRTEVWNVTHWMPRAAPPALTDKRPPMQEDGK